VAKNRVTQRKQREKQEVPTIALIGYTNAGKSTLFNRLTADAVSAQDRLFDTLDPVARSLTLPDKRTVVFLDTVGFVSDLPHQLVAAFKATLEETVRSTLLLHVLDIANPELGQQYQSVNQVLAELNVQSRPIMNVLNKSDLVESETVRHRMTQEWSGLTVSARNGQGIPELILAIQAQLARELQIYEVILPFEAAGRLDWVHQRGRVLELEYRADGIRLVAEMDSVLAARVLKH
ncbi:MAG TPA: GTPase HflX, partial [Bacillota bacterium]|nr:GTPase HflX [Bacillota bacterium]